MSKFDDNEYAALKFLVFIIAVIASYAICYHFFNWIFKILGVFQ